MAALKNTVMALAAVVPSVLRGRDKPKPESFRAMRSKAALTASHLESLIDTLANDELRELAAFALGAVQYIETAATTIERAEELAAIKSAAA